MAEEELDEIEYYEIVSIDEIIKLNPNFIAFSNEEIYNYLFNFLKSKSKADNFLNLFTSIIEQKKNKINTNNFIIVADAKRNNFKDIDDDDNVNFDIQDFITTIKNSNKEPIKEALKNKNKLWFPLIYDNESTKIKFNPSTRIKTVIDLTNEYSNDKYILFKDDERDIPILGVYYYEPVILNDDYLNHKIASHLIINKDKIKYEYKQSFNNKSFDELINNYKIDLPLIKIDKDEYHYGNMNSLFKKFNTDLDIIKIDEFNELKKYLELLIKEEEYLPAKYTKINGIKSVNIKNNRFYFFEFLNNSKKLSEITLTFSKKFEELIKTYTDEKTKTEYFPIINDLSNLIYNIKEDNIDEIIKNIKEVRKNLSIDNSVNFMKNSLNLDLNEINTLFIKIEHKYNILLNTYKDIFKISFSFKQDEAEIKKGNDINDYQGTPVVINEFKKNAVYIDENDDINESESDDEDNMKDKYNEFNKYYHNLEKGYSDALKIVLPFINKMNKLSKLPINYELLTTHLFNIYRGIPDKEIIIKNTIKGDYNDSYYKELASKTIKYVLTSDDEDIKIKEANIEYIKIIIDMIYEAICKWAILTQYDILSDNLLFIREKCYLGCIELWNEYGAPYDMSKKDGIIYYLLCIFKEVFNEEFSENDTKYYKIDKDYKNIIFEKLNKNYEEDISNFKKLAIKKKKENKGLETGKHLIEILKKKDDKLKDKLLNSFIEALIYMPSFKYQKIHKYLLGCCLEQIDENFTADTFIIKERKDILKAKKIFANERVLNKKRYKRFFIDKPHKEQKIIDFKEISNYINYDNIYSGTLNDWFESMKLNTNTIINIENINIIKSRLRETYNNHYDGYLPVISKKLYDIIKNKKYNFNNYKQILLAISHILYINLQKDSLIYISNINETIKELDKLSSIITDDNITEINQIITIIVIRGMCLPAYPNITDKNIRLIPKNDKISKEIFSKIISSIVEKVIKIINISIMPTQEDQLDYINKIRESNKDKIIAALNKKSREEKDIIKEMKKIGLNINDDDDNESKVNKEIKELDDDQPEDDNEYNLEEEDNKDEDTLDTQDFGFVYSS